LKKQIIHRAVSLFLLLVFCASANAQKVKELSSENVLDAMKKSSEYMVNTVSCNGGYLWKYAADFSEYFGEVTGKSSQIMTYGPGTPAMGQLFMDLYEATGDEAYLGYAKQAANALIYGQHPLGGWNYVIDFDPSGIEAWYENVASKIGAEEYIDYYGNCSYDDDATQGPTAFLLCLYMKTLLPEYLGPLKKALDFMLISQYPNGGWPQRYPLKYNAVHAGHPDYTSMYTLNDNAMGNIINVLIESYELLGDEQYLEAARSGGDFFMIAQGPEGHAGWAEQYDMDLQPCWARTFEAPGYMPRQTISTIGTLEKLFLFTGDRRYLRPIPMAIEWLETSRLGALEDGLSEFSRIYDPETNLPVFRIDHKDQLGSDGYPSEYPVYEHFPDSRKPFLGERSRHNLEEVIAQYERVNHVAEEDAQALYDELFRGKRRKAEIPDNIQVSEIIQAMNDQGAWIEEIKVHDSKPGEMHKDKHKIIRGIDVSTYIRNMKMMMEYFKN
jgi:PelA/Pel-15E family pectate lyase